MLISFFKKLPSLPSRRLLAKISLSFLVIFAIADVYMNESFMRHSIQMTLAFQRLGYYMDILATLASSIATYWIIGFIIGYLIISDKFLNFFYYYSIFCMPSIIFILLKTCYARGRPFLLDEEVRAVKCSCDYGMPSGHSTMAFSAYFILFDQLTYLTPGRSSFVTPRHRNSKKSVYSIDWFDM